MKITKITQLQSLITHQADTLSTRIILGTNEIPESSYMKGIYKHTAQKSTRYMKTERKIISEETINCVMGNEQTMGLK